MLCGNHGALCAVFLYFVNDMATKVAREGEFVLANMTLTRGRQLESDGFGGDSLCFKPSYLPTGKTAEQVAQEDGLKVQAASAAELFQAVLFSPVNFSYKLMDIFINLLKNRAFDEYTHHFDQRLAMPTTVVFKFVKPVPGYRAKGLHN